MKLVHPVSNMLMNEARALLTRIDNLQSFALSVPMVAAADISPSAQNAIDLFLTKGQQELRGIVSEYIRWLCEQDEVGIVVENAQKKFVFLKLRFNDVISQFDTFSDVLIQRSEHKTGVWLSGLDVVAADALSLPEYYESPPVICFLDRGMGAAIRRARTRLPGWVVNPVAIIQVPRERMVGSGIASSLVHEVGHQGSVLLGLVNSLRPVLQGMQHKGGYEEIAWKLYERWISEILADFWSVAMVGVSSTLGLMNVVSLPRTFVFRINIDAPHPIPWIRVKLSCAIGNAVYPHGQWQKLSQIWESLYPLKGLDDKSRYLLALLEAIMPAFISLLINHCPRSLRGNSLKEAISDQNRQPYRLAEYYRAWQSSPRMIRIATPSMVFAVIGQAKADGILDPREESRILSDSLSFWALNRASLNTLNAGITKSI